MTWPVDLPLGQPQIFYGRSRLAADGGTYWIKPPGISRVYFFIVSAGGGGGGALNAALSGSGGGGAGSVTRLLMPAVCVPDAIQVVVGQGGPGGTGANGSSGLALQLLGLNTTSEILLATDVGSGGVGTGAAGSPGIPTAATAWTNLGQMLSTAGGAAGAGGGVVTDGASSTAGITTGGGGGAGSGVQTGGASTGSLGYPNAIGAQTVLTAATSGYTIFNPLFLSVGGGGANTTFQNAEPGSYGCGGGGGGGGGTGNTIGGRGGDGLVMIWSW